MSKGQSAALGELCEVIGGGTPSTSIEAYWRGEIPWVSPKDMKAETIGDSQDHISQQAIQNSATSLVPSGSVLVVVRSGILARKIPIAITSKDLAINQDVKALRPNGKISSRYLFRFLEANEDELLSKVSRGATVHRLGTEALRELAVPVPPLPEQRRIVGILDKAFDAIATAKANTEKNLQNARAVFSSQLQRVLSKRGEGWVEKSLGETCVLRSGTTLPTEVERPSGDIPYLKVADMNLSENLDGVTSSSRYVNLREINGSNLFPVGTTIFPKRGGAILTNKKRLTTRVICADLNVMGVTPKSGLLPGFLFNYFLGLDLREISNGSSIPQINNYNIEPLSIAFPQSLAEQESIVSNLGSLWKQTKRLESLYERKLAALDELKKSLLHEAFHGRL